MKKKIGEFALILTVLSILLFSQSCNYTYKEIMEDLCQELATLRYHYEAASGTTTGTGELWFETACRIAKRTWSNCSDDKNLVLGDMNLKADGYNLSGYYWAGCSSAKYKYYIDIIFTDDLSSFSGTQRADYDNDGEYADNEQYSLIGQRITF